MIRMAKNYSEGHTTKWNAEEVRRSSASQQRRRKRKKRGDGPLYYLTLLLISAILAGIGWLLCNDLLALNKKPVTAEIAVVQGEKIGSVATSLKKAGLIDFKLFFLLYSSMSSTEIAPGTYELNTNMDYHALLVAMSPRSGARKIVEVTIPEGYSMKQIFALLEEKNVNTAAELSEVAANGDFDYDFLAGKEKGPSRLEGYLFPDTYQFYSGGDAKTVINKMLKNFDDKMTDDLMAAVNKSSYSLDQILTIASLIEKETDGYDEGKISSVIRNRLRNAGETGGYLQIDAALLYAIGEHKEVLTNADKEVESPYNLYKYKGLPPTPIANPGMASIRAALYPDSTNYYFYALGTDGQHHFSRTYREHQAFLASGQAKVS